MFDASEIPRDLITIGQRVADFAEEHLDVQLDEWQRDFLDRFYSVDPPVTSD